MKNTFRTIEENISKWIHLESISPEDIPTIELYMDQVTTFMDKQLSGNKRFAEDKILTKTMINNYSKNELLPPSNKKKYSKDHIILLIYIYYMKNFLSIGDIQQLLNPMSEKYFESQTDLTMSKIYSDIFHLEQEFGVKVRQSIDEIYEIASTHFSEDDYLRTFCMIALLSYDIYAKKQLIEKMIDSIFEKKTIDESSKKDKETVKQKTKEQKVKAKKSSKPI